MLFDRLFSSNEEWLSLDVTFIDNMLDLSQNNIQEFYNQLRSRLRCVHSKQSLDIFLEFNIHLETEIMEAAPFIAEELNIIFKIIIQSHYYSYLSQVIKLVEICASREILSLLKNIIAHVDLSRVIDYLDIYQIKKTIYTLSNRFSEKDDLICKIEMELTDIDMDWKNDIEI